MRRRKRCPYCRCLFLPDPRVVTRQWACPKPTCQEERRRETQRRYRAAHPDDPAARRLRAGLAAAKAGGTVAAPQGPPAAVGRLPWDELRDEISPQGLVITRLFVRLVVEIVRDEIRAQVRVLQRETGGLVPDAEKDETAVGAAPG
jgi:hypothetical protein